MWKRFVQLLLLTLFAVVIGSTAEAQNSAAVLVLVHANLIDGVSPDVFPDATIVVRDGRIESVGKNVSAPTGAQVIDIKGRWLLPGFVDAHVHLRDLAAARHAVQSGATTVRALGSSYFTDIGMRELHRAGLTDIPEVVAAGYQIRPDLSQGNGDFFLDFPGMNRFMSGLRGSENLRSVVRLLAEHHVDLIKILATERAGTPQTDPRKRTFTDEEMVAIVDEARKAGLPVAAHAHGDEGARGAVLAGVHSIEHGTYLSDDTLALMKTHGTYFVPTLSAVSHMSKLENPVLQLRGRAMLPRARDTATRAWKMGIKIVAATDSTYEGDRPVAADEIIALVGIGIPPMEAIKAGTSVSAECLGVGKRMGTIKPGMVADFVTVDANPLADIAALQDLVLVVHDGRVVMNLLNR